MFLGTIIFWWDFPSSNSTCGWGKSSRSWYIAKLVTSRRSWRWFQGVGGVVILWIFLISMSRLPEEMCGIIRCKFIGAKKEFGINWAASGGWSFWNSEFSRFLWKDAIRFFCHFKDARPWSSQTVNINGKSWKFEVSNWRSGWWCKIMWFSA